MVQITNAQDAREAAVRMRPGVFTALAETEEIEQAATRASGTLGPLAGLPLAVKDNIHVAGLPNSAGTRSLREYAPQNHAPTVARLIDAGMVVLGKTNMHELAVGITSSHGPFGDVPNAVDESRVAGGSSGGSAVAVAAGVCQHALGTDTGGSTRIPAAFNDVWGFRPSTGRYDPTGVTSIAFSRDTVGPMAVSLEGIVALDGALASPGPRLRFSNGGEVPLRVGVDFNDLEYCDDAVRSAFEIATDVLRDSLEIEFRPLNFGALDRQAASLGAELAGHELVPSLRSYLESDPALPTLSEVYAELSDPHVAYLIQRSLAMQPNEDTWNPRWHRLMTDSARLRAAFTATLVGDSIDVIIRPTVAIRPPLISKVRRMKNSERDELFGNVVRFTALATLVGAPSLSLPLGPVLGKNMTGMLLDALPGTDVRLLSAASRVEKILSSGR